MEIIRLIIFLWFNLVYKISKCRIFKIILSIIRARWCLALERLIRHRPRKLKDSLAPRRRRPQIRIRCMSEGRQTAQLRVIRPSIILQILINIWTVIKNWQILVIYHQIWLIISCIHLLEEPCPPKLVVIWL